VTAALLDTDVFSFVFKRDTRAALYAPHLTGVQPCLCFQSVAELRYWALARRWGDARCRSLDLSLGRCLILPYDDATSGRWAEITHSRRQSGRPIECGDAWIAATAIRHNLPLLTHNAADYAGIAGIQVVSHS
jgi:tRNA(fMet)-specific endonuclease VapC